MFCLGKRRRLFWCSSFSARIKICRLDWCEDLNEHTVWVTGELEKTVVQKI